MTTKLTLKIKKDIIERAKVYAKINGCSLSELVEAHLEGLIQENSTDVKMSRKLKGLVGSVKLPKGFDEKRELDVP
jgi:Family of unknown function (DUF6364)